MVKEYGYEYDAALNEKIWNETEGKVTNTKLWGALCLRSGRDALKAIAREYEPCTALLPALACDSMVFPFVQYGHKVEYYKLKSDYTINLDSVDFKDERILFLYMDYFGRRAISDKDLNTLKAKGNVTLIEDRTHNLIWDRTSGISPDYTIASLRKWLPIPDGGLLWGNISKTLTADTTFSKMRLKAQCMRHDYLSCGDEKIKTEYRKIFSTVSDLMEHDGPSAMSAYSYELAKQTDWNDIRHTRRTNARTLTSILQSSPYVTLIQNETDQSDLYVVFTVPKRDEVQKRLSSMGIFNTIIWPLAQEQKQVCQVAKFTEENMLAAPCDQRYTEEDMKYIGAEIVRVITDVNR